MNMIYLIKNHFKYLYYRNRGRNLMAMYKNIIEKEFDGDFLKAEKFFGFLIEFKREAKECVNHARDAKKAIRTAGMFD